MSINAKVGMEKQEHPERFCPQKGCLWRTAKLNHVTQQHEGGGYCPRHKPAKQLVMEWLRDYPVRHDTTENHILWLLSRRFAYLSSNELKMYLDEFMQGVKAKAEPDCESLFDTYKKEK